MPRRRYTHQDIATALAAYKAAGDNAAEAHRVTGIPVENIRRWVKNPEPEAANMVPEKERSLTQELESVAYALVRAIPDKINEASLNHVSVSLGIAIDKLRLLRGEATDISEVREGDGRRELDDVLDRLASRHAPQSSETRSTN